MRQPYSLELDADYFQLFIYDAELDVAQVEVGADWWTQDDQQRMLSIKESNQLLVMATFRNLIVPVEVAVLDEPPPINEPIEWDQINECGLHTPSGSILIRGLGNEDKEGLIVKTGVQFWRIRLYGGGLATLDQMALEGTDKYRIELWPTRSIQPLNIIKQNSYYLI